MTGDRCLVQRKACEIIGTIQPYERNNIDFIRSRSLPLLVEL